MFVHLNSVTKKQKKIQFNLKVNLFVEIKNAIIADQTFIVCKKY